MIDMILVYSVMSIGYAWIVSNCPLLNLCPRPSSHEFLPDGSVLLDLAALDKVDVNPDPTFWSFEALTLNRR